MKEQGMETTQEFKHFDLPEALKEQLVKMGYVDATPVQAQAIPHILAGKDVLASAQTGTGKTGAFTIPIIANLIESKNIAAIILTPTRELAKQIFDIIKVMTQGIHGVKPVMLIGGEPMGKQLKELKLRPRIIVGTPGRVNDHLERRTLNLDNVKYLVLDETDRMLDMGFGIQIDAVVECIPADRQTLLFSATLPKEIMRLSNNYLKDPVRVSSGEVNAVADNIKQEVKFTDSRLSDLYKTLEENTGSALIFVRTQRGAEELKSKLLDRDFAADVIHGGLRQSRRDRVIKDFRNEKHNIMVATDVAARGLDIPHINLVVNYDVPLCPEDYIHRIGRTARAGASGKALSLVCSQDKGKWRAVLRFMKGSEQNIEGADKDSYEDRSSSRGGYGGGRSGGGFGGGRDRFGKTRESSFSRGGNSNRAPRTGGGRFESSDRPRRFEGAAPRSDAPRSDAPRSEYPRRENSEGANFFKRREGSFGDAPRSYAPRGDGPRGDAPRSYAPRGDSPRSDAPRGYAPRGDGPRGYAPRSDAPRGEFQRGDRPFGRPEGRPGERSESSSRFGFAKKKTFGAGRNEGGSRPFAKRKPSNGPKKDFVFSSSFAEKRGLARPGSDAPRKRED